MASSRFRRSGPAHVGDGLSRVPLGTRPARSVVGGRRGRTDSRKPGPRVLGPGDERGAVFPIATLALWAIASALARPSLARQALVGGAIVLALATHVRLVALIPALFVAVALQCGFARSLESARRLAILLAATAGACVVTFVGFALAGRWNDVFGAYAAAAGGYELRRVARTSSGTSAVSSWSSRAIPLVALATMSLGCVAGACAIPPPRARRDHRGVDVVSRARGRNIRLEVGGPRRGARPADRRAAALARLRACGSRGARRGAGPGSSWPPSPSPLREARPAGAPLRGRRRRRSTRSA